MDNIIFEYMKKSKKSNTLSKYKLKYIKGLLSKDFNIVVKIGLSQTIEKEYKISQLLLNIKGFIIYLCYFTCVNEIGKIIKDSSICSESGDNIKILLMKEYELGSIKGYNWTKENFKVLKSLIKQILTSLFIAFQKYGFIHNDVHFGNFLIKETEDKIIKYNEEQSIESEGYRVITMDFEKSLFDVSKTEYGILCQNYQQIINNILWELNIITKNKEHIIEYIEDNIKNKNIIDYNKLNIILKLVDNLEMLEKRDMSKLQPYNANIFMKYML
jgi:hypothetical protein